VRKNDQVQVAFGCSFYLRISKLSLRVSLHERKRKFNIMLDDHHYPYCFFFQEIEKKLKINEKGGEYFEK
jgi:hypothetical protein